MTSEIHSEIYWPLEIKTENRNQDQFEIWPQCALAIAFLASITMEVKNSHAHVTTQRILNKFIKINFSVACMVWLWCWLFWHGLPVKIFIRCKRCGNLRRYFQFGSILNIPTKSLALNFSIEIKKLRDSNLVHFL